MAMTEKRIPLSALLLGLGGLIPFVACVIMIWTGITLPLLDDPPRAILAYGAVILSFLGGVRWGFALRIADTGLQARTFCLAVAPSIAAWLTLLGPVLMGLAAMPVMFLLLGFADEQLPKIGAPVWYCKLRRLLTAAVVLACLAAITGLVR
jgi:Protein of unknown function (DUF3429)